MRVGEHLAVLGGDDRGELVDRGRRAARGSGTARRCGSPGGRAPGRGGLAWPARPRRRPRRREARSTSAGLYARGRGVDGAGAAGAAGGLGAVGPVADPSGHAVDGNDSDSQLEQLLLCYGYELVSECLVPDLDVVNPGVTVARHAASVGAEASLRLHVARVVEVEAAQVAVGRLCPRDAGPPSTACPVSYGAQVSLARSASHLVTAVSTRGPVGVDVEEVERVDRAWADLAPVLELGDLSGGSERARVWVSDRGGLEAGRDGVRSGVRRAGAGPGPRRRRAGTRGLLRRRRLRRLRVETVGGAGRGGSAAV